MKKKPNINACTIACVILFSSIPFSGHAQKNEGIHFETDSLAILLAKAKQENKLIFIDCYASWCGPCKTMAADVFTDDTVAKFYNSNFINIKIDMDKGEGPEIAGKYAVKCMPTFLFIDSTGTLMHRKSSACAARRFIELGEDALNPEIRFCTLQKKYESGTLTSSEFVRYLSATCAPVEDQLAEYENNQTEADFTDRQNWTVLYSLISDPHSRMFQYLLSHRDIYAAGHTADSVNQIIERVYGSAMSKCLSKKDGADTAEYKKLRAEVVSLNEPALGKFMLGSDIYLCTLCEDWDAYADSTIAYVEKYATEDDCMLLNYFAWAFYEHVDDTAYLDTAISWAKRSVEMQPMYFNTDTYAALLYKRGRCDEALAQAKLALKRAKKEKETDVAETEDLVKKIKAAKKSR